MELLYEIESFVYGKVVKMVSVCVCHFKQQLKRTPEIKKSAVRREKKRGGHTEQANGQKEINLLSKN